MHSSVRSATNHAPSPFRRPPPHPPPRSAVAMPMGKRKVSFHRGISGTSAEWVPQCLGKVLMQNSPALLRLFPLFHRAFGAPKVRGGALSRLADGAVPRLAQQPHRICRYCSVTPSRASCALTAAAATRLPAAAASSRRTWAMGPTWRWSRSTSTLLPRPPPPPLLRLRPPQPPLLLRLSRLPPCAAAAASAAAGLRLGLVLRARTRPSGRRCLVVCCLMRDPVASPSLIVTP